MTIKQWTQCPAIKKQNPRHEFNQIGLSLSPSYGKVAGQDVKICSWLHLRYEIVNDEIFNQIFNHCMCCEYRVDCNVYDNTVKNDSGDLTCDTCNNRFQCWTNREPKE